MPSGKTHFSVGVGTGLALCSGLPLENGVDTTLAWLLVATVGGCAIAALAPDLDIDNNELEEMGRDSGDSVARRLKRAARHGDRLDRAVAAGAGTIFKLAGELTSRVFELLAWAIQRVTVHRGLTHSILALVITTGVALGLSWAASQSAWWGIVWGAGYASHLVSDAWTWSGVRFGLPFSERRCWLLPRLLRFRVGTWRDTVLRVTSPFVGGAILLWQSGLLEVFEVLAPSAGVPR